MQLEEKLVEDRGAARAESQQREDVLEHGEDQLPASAGEAVHDASVELRNKLLGAIRMVLDDQRVDVTELRLPAREAHALDALQVAVSARSSGLGTFVFASDRRDMLEQALAVLQPNLTQADGKSARELQIQFADLTARVGALRHVLSSLEDAQDELVESQQKAALAQGDAAPGDKPKPTPSDPDAPRPATTLTGPERAAPAPPATTLVGPELAARARPATTLVGPELPEPPPPPTTLVGPELPEPPPPPSTLIGPELPEPPPEQPPSTLGDAAELAKAARPWWRRPFG